ncbi:DNase I [Pyrrhoderma noxium]|uniref:DNA-(apurinic or apyrimidinic site) endonuclease 2 n=1 Tax=Pyrrhoderma noxium TaxID=2282107 RepID=A0A286UK40_9AGAM|nr:DNase I [Pyrrhoderma noxium]
MRLLTWNINGIRTLPKYHPWNALKTGDAILNELGADIICFQEIKSSRQMVQKDLALPESYDAFFSFPIAKGGYSGVSVYTKRSQCQPLKAEEGLSGHLQSGLKPPLTSEERISCDLPLAHELNLLEDSATATHLDLYELDKEGRALILDFGLFVLINLYCPNETSDARLPYKMNFHLLLEERVRRLVEIDKREVIVTGDINGFLLGPPGTECTPVGTKKSMPHGDILPSIKGSDHCPVYIDLHDEIVNEDGVNMSLKEFMKLDEEIRGTPRLATKYWAEYSGKQKLLSNFFGKKGAVIASEASTPIVSSIDKDSPPFIDPDVAQSVSTEGKRRAVLNTQTVSQVVLPTLDDIKPSSKEELVERPTENPLTATNISATDSHDSLDGSSIPTTSTKRKKMQADSNYPPQATKKAKTTEQKSKSKAKSTKKLSSQSKLSSFFTESSPSQDQKDTKQKTIPPGNSLDAEVIDVDALMDASDAIDNQCSQPQSQSQFQASPPPTPSPSLTVPGSSVSDVEDEKEKKGSHSWSALFARVEPPRCIVHGEPARQFTVNKPGPNRGKTFFVCSRPVGPGYDAGRDVRRREEVDPRYRCNYFKWSQDLKRESLRDRT